MGFTFPGGATTSGGSSGVILPWVTATAYVAGQPVTNGGRTYTAVDSHTSGATFAGDLAAHWSLIPVGEAVNTVAATGSTETLPDVTTATIHLLTLDANCTITFPTAAAGKSFTVELVQDATGNRTVTWPGTVSWAGGLTPTLTPTAAKKDIFSFLCVDGTNWFGFIAGQNF